MSQSSQGDPGHDSRKKSFRHAGGGRGGGGGVLLLLEQLKGHFDSTSVSSNLPNPPDKLLMCAVPM